MSAGASPTGGAGRFAITAAALATIYLQAVNISVPNAALPHIQGALSMSLDEVGWAFTAYMAASAVTLPATRWLTGRLGRKLVFQACLSIFAVGLALDTLTTTTESFVFARIVQGAASGPLAPLALKIWLEISPAARHARINLAAAATALLGISSGASVGGFLSEYYGWRSIFYVGLPVAALIFIAIAAGPPETKPSASPRFDVFGWATFSVGLTGLQIVLDGGERLEWFASPLICAAALASAFGFYLFIAHVLTAGSHFLDRALFRDRNFMISTIVAFAVGFVLLPTLALTSPMLEELLGYPVDTTGYMTLPRGVALVATLIATGFLPARIDSRWLVVAGLTLVGYATWRMVGYSPTMDGRPVAVAGLLQGVGLGLVLPALTKTAFATLDPKLRPEGTELFNLSRLYGSTLGIAVVQVFFYNNTQAVHLALAKHLTPYRAAAPLSHVISQAGLASLNDAVSRQAAFVAVIDQFKLLAIVVLIAVPLALVLRPPRASP